eukprot:scaffold12660_cov68-Phaeocystis_antarctica.AAC.2
MSGAGCHKEGAPWLCARSPAARAPKDGPTVRRYPANRKKAHEVACASRSNRARASPGSSTLALPVGLALALALALALTLTLTLTRRLALLRATRRVSGHSGGCSRS